MNFKFSPAKVADLLGALATAAASTAITGIPAAIPSYLKLAQSLLTLPATTDADIEALTAKVQKMVDENRGPTDAEIDELDAQIASNSDAIQALRPPTSGPSA